MNSKNRQLRLIMLALMLIPFMGVYAQVNEITLSKPGRLEKELGKFADDITSLKVNGSIDGEDIEYIITMSKLVSLDLGNARIVEGYSFPAKNRVVSGLLKRYVGISQKNEYDKGTLLVSGSRFFKKLVPPMGCKKIVVLSPTESDETYNLPYFQIGELSLDWGIVFECSKPVVIEVLDCKWWDDNTSFDYMNSDNRRFILATNPFIIKKESGKNILWRCNNIDEFLSVCQRNGISNLHSTFTNAFSSLKCSDTLDLRKLPVREITLPAFAGCPAKYLILSPMIEKFSARAFVESSIETVEFTSKKAPEYERNGNYYYPDLEKNLTMIVPEKCSNNYKSYNWDFLHVKEKNANTEYEFTIDKPGSLGNYLTIEITKKVERLTLKGAIYDTDVKYINECNELTYLDLTYCFVAKSPETIQKEKANQEFQAAVFQMLGEMAQKNAQNQFEHGNISYGEAMNSVVWGEYAKQVAELISQDKVEANDNCMCPKIDLWKLKEYHMPIQAKIIDLGSCKSLEKVILPPKATAIQYGAFRGCGELKELSFPSTLIRIGGGAFCNCKSLDVLNFSKTQLVEIVESRDGTFEGCKNLKAVAFPSTFQKMTESTSKSPMCHWYFLSKEKPQYVRVPDGIVHIPKGCINGWRALANDQHIRLVDDIEIVDK